jgi:hypothetical protein
MLAVAGIIAYSIFPEHRFWMLDFSFEYIRNLASLTVTVAGTALCWLQTVSAFDFVLSLSDVIDILSRCCSLQYCGRHSCHNYSHCKCAFGAPVVLVSAFACHDFDELPDCIDSRLQSTS